MANIKRANTSGITKSGVAIPDVPDAPTIGAATNVGTSRAYNNGSATVAFTASATGGTPLRKNYAGIGFTYDETRDAFIPPKPTEGNWVLDEETCLWKSND